MNENVGSTCFVDDFDFEAVTLGNGMPNMRSAGAAERIDADSQMPAERMASRSMTFSRSCT